MVLPGESNDEFISCPKNKMYVISIHHTIMYTVVIITCIYWVQFRQCTAIKHPVTDRVKPSFVIVDIRAL